MKTPKKVKAIFPGIGEVEISQERAAQIKRLQKIILDGRNNENSKLEAL